MSAFTMDIEHESIAHHRDQRRDPLSFSVLDGSHPRWGKYPLVHKPVGSAFTPQPGVASVLLVRSGWLCREKILEDGRRQILALVLPGETCGLQTALNDPRKLVVALSPSSAVAVQRTDFQREMESDPDLRKAVDAAVTRQTAMAEEHLISLGRLSAVERTAHLICELAERLDIHESRNFDFPLTQIDLSDMLGLSVVHMNRTLQSLRKKKLIALSRGKISVLSRTGLNKLSLFNPAYLGFVD